MLGSFVESHRHLLRVIFIAPPSIASNFFLVKLTRNPPYKFIFYFILVLQGDFGLVSLKKITLNRWRGLSTKDPNAFKQLLKAQIKKCDLHEISSASPKAFRRRQRT